MKSGQDLRQLLVLSIFLAHYALHMFLNLEEIWMIEGKLWLWLDIIQQVPISCSEKMEEAMMDEVEEINHVQALQDEN